MGTLYKNFIKDTNGATAIEYGLIAALIAVAVIGSISALGSTNSASYQNTYNQIAAAIGG